MILKKYAQAVTLTFYLSTENCIHYDRAAAPDQNENQYWTGQFNRETFRIEMHTSPGRRVRWDTAENYESQDDKIN